MLRVVPVHRLPDIRPGDEIGDLVAAAIELDDGDVLVVTSKIVSKAEGSLMRVLGGDPDPDAVTRVVEQQSRRVLRRRDGLVISETEHGFVCANAGVDRSNMPLGFIAILPADPDRSARHIRDRVRARAGVEVGVVVSDTFGRPWRRGVTDVALGCAGVAAVVDLRGTLDTSGEELRSTQVCVADELAAAAELVMGKTRRVPVALIRGVDPSWLRESSVREEVVRPPAEDLFR